jgi:Ca2+-transporting ATPase
MALWHIKTVANTLRELGTSESGLSQSEATTRLLKYGKNAFPETRPDGIFAIFVRQFEGPLIYILLAAAGIVFAIGEIVDSLVILAVLIVNAIIGSFQEGKAQGALLSLRKLVGQKATVIREGRDVVIADTELVPGDILVLREGEKVPADARVILSYNLKANEASLTGESEPIRKHSDVISNERASVADEENIVFKGTHIVAGNGTAVVFATGLHTELGKIAQKIISIDTAVPLAEGVRKISRALIIGVAVSCLLIFSLGLFRGETIFQMFRTVVAVAVSAIPEGLPVALTLILAAGVWRMSKKNVLVKRMQAVEALGHTKIIAVDKTGTLTKNEMVVERLYTNGVMFEISGNGYEPVGNIFMNNKMIDAPELPEIVFAARVAAYSSTARLSYVSETKQWLVAGDPTEAALGVFGEKGGFRTETVNEEAPKVFELPFDYAKKTHMVVRKSGEKNFLALTGAPESVIDACHKVFHSGEEQKFSPEMKREMEKEMQHLARAGYRVVAYAWSAMANEKFDSIPPLVFGGFFGIRDALRPQVRETVAAVHAAGMRVVMITGDHKLTAEAIARDAGIFHKGDVVLSGTDIDELSDTGLQNMLAGVSVFARVTPEHKLRIIEAYRARGEVIAMTGDGVNDAPSLVAADLGVALGEIGTEVAKDASDIILLDDNFGNITAAAEEGRNIYETVRKVVLYLVSTSFGEVLVIVGALALGFPIPLTPSQIIWLNFVTDGFLTVALAMEPKEKNLLLRPRTTSRSLLDAPAIVRAILMGATMAGGTLLLFAAYTDFSWGKAITMGLTVLAIFQWMNAFNCRSERESAFTKNIQQNKWLFYAFFFVFVLQLFAVYAPFLQKILSTEALGFFDWVVMFLVSLSIIFIEEIRKFIFRRIYSTRSAHAVQ